MRLLLPFRTRAVQRAGWRGSSREASPQPDRPDALRRAKLGRGAGLFQGVWRKVWSRWRDDVTLASKYLFAAVILAVIGTVSVAIPIYQMFCALAVLLGVAEIFGVIFRPKVALAGKLPDKTAVGEPITGWFHVQNVARRPALDVGLGFSGLPPELEQLDADQILPCLRAGQTATLPVTLAAKRRGLYALPPLQARSTFPFNLVRSGSSRLPLESLLVVPAFHPLERLRIPLGTRYQPGGIVLTSHVGESPEYIGNREYVAGEPARRLDFRSWARLAKPVVREYQEEYYCRIALVLDTFIPPELPKPATGFADFEAAVSLTASLADALAGGEYIIDLFAAGKDLYVFRAGRHTAHFENLLEILACVEPCRQDPFGPLLPLMTEELQNVSTAVCVFLDWNDPRRRLAQSILETGCHLQTLLVRESEPSQPFDLDGGQWQQFTPDQVRRGGLSIP